MSSETENDETNNSNNFTSSKKEYYKYLHQYHPDRPQNNNSAMSNLFRIILQMYVRWKQNPNDPKLSPLNIDPQKLGTFLFDKSKSKKAKYYCVNHKENNIIVDNNNMESIIIKHISEYFLELFVEKKEITPNFLDTIYQTANGAPGLVNILTNNTNKKAIHNIIVKLIESSNSGDLSNLSDGLIKQNKNLKKLIDSSSIFQKEHKPELNSIGNISKVYFDAEGNKIDENVVNNIKTEDIVYNVNVSMLDIYNNVKKELNVNQKIICTKCNGKGILDLGQYNSRICHRCNGLLTENINKVFKLDIRKKQTTYPREGHQGIDRNYGDLIINVLPKTVDNYKIENDYDLVTEVELGFVEVYTQFDFYLQYINGMYYHIKFSPRNLSNKDYNKFRKKLQIRVRDKGLPIQDTGRFGDLYINFRVILPDIDPIDIPKLESIPSLHYDRKTLVHVDNTYNDVQDDLVDKTLLAIEFV
jgi:DnaJ-class molecular chaperone